MPRLPRFFAPGAPLHVIQRGNDRQAIYRDLDDRRAFMELLQRAIARNGIRLHAYVLMTNHVHLLLTPSDRDGVGRTMQSVGRVYVQRFNTRHRRTGTLWEGRYKAAVVDGERYLLTCMRYIELNPVRARIVATPGDYVWSSFQANACGMPSTFIERHAVYQALGSTAVERQCAYRELFRHAIPEADLCVIRDSTQNAWAMGDEAFRAKIDATGRRAARLPMGRPRRRSDDDSESRV